MSSVSFEICLGSRKTAFDPPEVMGFDRCLICPVCCQAITAPARVIIPTHYRKIQNDL